MSARISSRVAPAALVAGLVAIVPFPAAWAGGGHGGGAMLQGGGAFHGGGTFHAGGAFRGGHPGSGHMGGIGYRPGFRGLPPLAGVIHERPGSNPSFTFYGHTGTALPRYFAGGGGAGVSAYGHTNTGLVRSHVGSGLPAYGHVTTGLPFQRYGRGERFARNVEGYGRRQGLGVARGRLAAGFGGGFIGGYGGDVGGFDEGGSYGGSGSYGSVGTSGGSGTYGGTGTYGGGLSYVSETPLAATFAEPPLAPSPGEGYSPGDRYAYAASADVGPGPRIITVHHDDRRDCGCGQRAQPMVYRYGVGTAY